MHGGKYEHGKQVSAEMDAKNRQIGAQGRKRWGPKAHRAVRQQEKNESDITNHHLITGGAEVR